MARAPEPSGHGREGWVPRHEPGNQQDRLPAGVGDALAAEDRVAPEPGRLDRQAPLAPDRGLGEYGWDTQAERLRGPAATEFTGQTSAVHRVRGREGTGSSGRTYDAAMRAATIR